MKELSKKILFSAIGGNDPVSSATEYDGSMLHICRHYKPDIVYLYLSKKMLERHERDNRYCYCIEQLGKRLEHKFEVHCIAREELEEVQEYDYYYEDFKPILEEIRTGMNAEDILFANIASGTPAMKSALLLLAVMAEYRFVPIQVKTPIKDINVHLGKDEDYDPEYYWEVNKDNEPIAENRCVETQCPRLATMLKKNIIIRHIETYNYPAAFMLAEEIKADISEEAYDLLRAAVARLQLDLPKVKSIELKYGYKLLPVRQEGDMEFFEYALTMQIKMIRKEYGDFMRAISPLISDLFEMILFRHCEIDIKKYCEKKHNIWLWNVARLKNDTVGLNLLHILNQEFAPNTFRNSPVAASNLKPILMHYIQDIALKEKLEKMRDIEAEVRNMAAHEIVCITDEKLKKMNLMSVHQMFSLIQKLTVAAKIHITAQDWKSYDFMNQLIIQKMQ
ncbi:MAG: hypothetical protein NC089_04900 [Bacteroides sp.]|nr:hypothetical protein [Bacteroides sp.]MCM1548734.1 CRISPR-associated protein Csm6 [Clostridium sp.]